MSTRTTPSVFEGSDPTKTTLASVQRQLGGKTFRNIEGFYSKYFEGQPWSAVVEEKLRHRKAVKVLNKLSPDLSAIGDFSTIADWLADFQNLFFQPNQDNFHWHTHQLSRKNEIVRTGVSLEISDTTCIAGSTRVFGVVYHTSGRIIPDDEDDTQLLHARAQQIFSSQPARCFVHGFMVRGPILELWVIDRAGAYSSGKLNLVGRPDLFVHVLAGYTLMSDAEAGLNTFVKRLSSGADSHVNFDEVGRFDLHPKLIATADYIVGPGTTCYVASDHSVQPKTDVVVKFSWRADEDFTEARIMEKARDRKTWGTVKLVAQEDLASMADIRQGLRFPQKFENQMFSCMVTAPFGRPIRLFSSISELLEALRDLVKALKSLYLDAGILHRDIAIKNLIIAPQINRDDPKGVLIDFNFALDLDDKNYVHQVVGSDGFMAIGVLWGDRHTYRHDLEALFYVFLWFAIANDRVHDHGTEIMQGLPEASRLRQWCSMDFLAVGKAKLADMEPEGFEMILKEFSTPFVHLTGLARELHALLFPVRGGETFIDTDTDASDVQRLYDGMAKTFDAKAQALR
jgi:hypothetical protein